MEKKDKKLKILVANATLALLAGSETHTLTLAKQLKRMGHEIFGFSPELGIIAEEMKKDNIPCYNNISVSGVKPFSFILEEKPQHDYDIIIANHNKIVEYLRNQFPRTPIISTIHGIIHKSDNEIYPEHPALHSGVNQFISVSEEVQQKLRQDYNIDSLIIRNFIDLNYFKTKKRFSPKIKQILINTNYNTKDDEEIKIFKEVANHYGAKLAAVGMNFIISTDMQKAIEDSDIVVGMGRSVLEGMAMGKIGFVHGRWGSAGIAHAGNIEEMRTCNFSGRNSKGLMVKEEIIDNIDKHYNLKNSHWSREYISNEHNAVFAAESYVHIARELLGQNIQQEAPLRPYRRAKDVKKSDTN